VLRTIVLLRFLSDPGLRETIAAITNRVEAFHGFADWLAFGAEGGVIARNDPVYQEKLIKFNQLLANCAIYSTAVDITATSNSLAAEGHPTDPVDLATVTPYITTHLDAVAELTNVCDGRVGVVRVETALSRSW
jgi:Tn3 transposase DDE domain